VLQGKVEANEVLRAEQTRLGMPAAQPLPFLCECADVRCRAIIRLTADEYAEARATPTRCVCVEGHIYAGHVVAAGEGYVLTEED
jgi:hypothetical protein